MYKTYQSIFSQRGQDYHKAMLDVPDARDQEFQAVIELAELSEDQLILDIPSGGGYLNNYIDKPVNLVAVETSHEFVRNLQPTQNLSLLVCHDLCNLVLPSNSVDRIISLAGLHHLENKHKFYQECFRLLKPGGWLCMADAYEGSKVAKFLNVFVDANNSMGHEGTFFNDSTIKELQSSGFDISYNAAKQYHWLFDSPLQMATYCKQLFGMDLSEPENIIKGIDQYLGYEQSDDQCKMNWELQFYACYKQP